MIKKLLLRIVISICVLCGQGQMLEAQVPYVFPPAIWTVHDTSYFSFRSADAITGQVSLYDQDNLLLENFLLLQADTLGVSIDDVGYSTQYYYSISDVTGELLDTGALISPSASSGDILVYFNHPVESSLSDGEGPVTISGQELFEAVISFIDSARSTIDVAMYNNNRTDLVNALNRASERGVRVRYIADDETGNIAIKNNVLEFPVVYGNEGDPLMHNKFFIIDAHSTADAWVLGGSTNMTTGQIATDPNNLIAIQDKSLALVYEQEFEEMWGGRAELPDPFMARFGNDKMKNSPHHIQVGDVMVECYFSPSDETETAILQSLSTADRSIEMALLLITSNDIGDKLIDLYREGLEIRMIVNNESSPGSEFDDLEDEGVNIIEWPESNILHHKYAIIDRAYSGPRVITGSHNWTFSANTINDENTLIIKDATITNIYTQEFEARWCEAGIGDCVTSTADHGHELIPEVIVYPNPASHRINIDQGVVPFDEFTIWNTSGQMVMAGRPGLSGGIISLDVSHLQNGYYFIRLQKEDSSFVIKWQKVE